MIKTLGNVTTSGSVEPSLAAPTVIGGALPNGVYPDVPFSHIHREAGPGGTILYAPDPNARFPIDPERGSVGVVVSWVFEAGKVVESWAIDEGGWPYTFDNTPPFLDNTTISVRPGLTYYTFRFKYQGEAEQSIEFTATGFLEEEPPAANLEISYAVEYVGVLELDPIEPPQEPASAPYEPPEPGVYLDLRTVDPVSHTAWFEANTDHPEQSTVALAANVEMLNQDYLFATEQISETQAAQSLATYFGTVKDQLLAEHGPSDIASDFEFMETVAQNTADGHGPVFQGGGFDSLGAFLAVASAWSNITATHPFPAGAILPNLLNVHAFPNWQSYIHPSLK